MARRAFREDLYYRLRRVVLTVPPLRERGPDIVLLVEHVRRAVNARYGLAVAGVAKDALDRLREHAWPGNVRELEAVLEQAMIFQGDGWVGAEDLGLPRRPSVRKPASRVPAVREAEPREERGPSATRRQTAVRLAAAAGSITSGELAAEDGISGEQARRELVALAKLGQLRRVGGGRNTRYVMP